MKASIHPHAAQTRPVFRVLAAVLAGLLVLIGFPAAMVEIERSGALAAVLALCSLWGGIGMGIGAWTGRWPGAL